MGDDNSDLSRVTGGIQNVRQFGSEATGLLRDIEDAAGGKGLKALVTVLALLGGGTGVFIASQLPSGQNQALVLAMSFGVFLGGILYNIFYRLINKLILFAVIIGLTVGIFLLLKNAGVLDNIGSGG